jgi:oxygen-independent coproporphyrinogen-3 oxidase
MLCDTGTIMDMDLAAFRNLYLHIPFCSGKCTYCAFYSEPFALRRADLFLDALEREVALATASCRPAPDTLYIGGGTPSLLSTPQWQRLCAMLHRRFDLGTLSEWTVEANPGTVSSPTAGLWMEQGVTRVSLGAQSMCDATLARIHRRHNAAQTVETLQTLRQTGFRRLGLDLIACLPEVTPTEWASTLQTAADLQPGHLSVYACSIEPGSLLDRQQRQGLCVPATGDDEQQALDTASALLASRGYEHYEISNYAMPGERCRYNLNVWNGEDYIGFGPAAASRSGLRRWTNTPDLDAYCASSQGDHPPRDIETLTPSSDAAERLMFRFRLSDAVDLESFADRHGAAARQRIPFWQKRLEELAEHGIVACVNGGWHRTPQGERMADAIAEALLPDPGM